SHNWCQTLREWIVCGFFPRKSRIQLAPGGLLRHYETTSRIASGGSARKKLSPARPRRVYGSPIEFRIVRFTREAIRSGSNADDGGGNGGGCGVLARPRPGGFLLRRQCRGSGGRGGGAAGRARAGLQGHRRQ